MILKWPWPSRKRNWEAAVLRQVILAGFPRMATPVDITVNAHPPNNRIYVGESLTDDIANLIVDLQIAPAVQKRTLRVNGMVRHGHIRITLTAAQ